MGVLEKNMTVHTTVASFYRSTVEDIAFFNSTQKHEEALPFRAARDVVMGNKMNEMINYGKEEDKIAISNQLDYTLLLSYHVQRGRLILEFFPIYYKVFDGSCQFMHFWE